MTVRMRRWIFIGLALVAAGVAGWTWRASTTREAAEASTSVAGGKPATPRASFVPPASASREPAKLRRLLSTRLGHPPGLRIERVRVVRSRNYEGVSCGQVAWDASSRQAAASKRFIATRRNVLVEGSADFEIAWRRVCEKG